MLVQALGKLHDLSCAVIGPTTALRTTDHDENILSTLTLLASVCKMSYAASIHVTLSCTGASSMK
jgi:tartrate dehydratase beta subunit/fumarate hydratase class I family protein